MAKILNKCPICGYPLEYSALMQYTNIYKLKSNGELTKNRVRKEDNGSMECGYISCINCDFVTNCDFRCSDYPHITIFQEGSKLFYEDNSTN